jgi:pyrroline-5-carboxylate reductase
MGVTYGLLGVGEIAAAIVTGLCLDDPPTIVLSPRNAARAAALADRHPSVSVAADNQTVIDSCDVLVIALRPEDGRTVLPTLDFRPGQPVISLLAGVSIDELAELVAPATDLARAIPLPPVARRTGVTPVHPATEAATALFDRLGGAAVVEDIRAFEAMSAASGTIAAHLAYLATISGWLTEQGVAPEEASRYVGSMFAGLADELGGDLEAVAAAHATPGGLNERFAARLEEAGTLELVRRSLDAILADLRA